MENPISCLTHRISEYFVQLQEGTNTQNEQPDIFKKTPKLANCSLIRVHVEKLLKTGEISFPCRAEIWRNYFNNGRNDNFKLREELFEMFVDNDEGNMSRRDFLREASKWPLPVERIQMANERCILFMQRKVIIENVMRQVLLKAEIYGKMRKNPQQMLVLNGEFPEILNDLSLYRSNLIAATLKRVLEYSSWSLIQSNAINEARESKLLQLQVCSVAGKQNDQECNKEIVTIKVGIVSDPSVGGKLAKNSTQEYLSLRSNDMRLMAMHKYGIRVKDDVRFCDLMERLGTAAVTVDLLEVKHSSPVQIIRNGQGSTKGASFILYNSARLETLLRTFDERVARFTYGQLPHIDQIDFSLLNQEEEWQLIFGYICAFPNLIERCVEQLQQGICATHLIIRFLSGFVSIFSVYYRRIRILTETRDHLMPIVYARIYLIKVIREILNKTLALLNIEPVQFM